jgi:hypothetical protein
MGNPSYLSRKGHLVSYLRFTPSEYEAISRLNRSLSLNRYPLPAFRRLLIASLADTLPELARRVAGLRRQQIQLLYRHLQDRPRAERRHDLAPEEVGLVADAAGPLLFRARFARHLKRALVEHFGAVSPALATKLERLSLYRFEALCEQVQERVRRGA